jgi:hypothetical protein
MRAVPSVSLADPPAPALRRAAIRVGALALSAFAVSLSGCVFLGLQVDTIVGSGNLSTREFEVSDLHHVTFALPGELIIDTGEDEGLFVEGDDNIVALVEARASSRTLAIEAAGSVNFVTRLPLRCRLTVVSLHGITNTGSGSIRAPAIDTNRLVLENHGSGDVRVEGRMDGDTLRARVAGSGRIRCDLTGEVQRQDIEVSGSGRYEAPDLVSRSARAIVTGSGGGVLRVSGELQATIEGSGSIYYLGNPEVKSEIRGSGAVLPFVEILESRSERVPAANSPVQVGRVDSAAPLATPLDLAHDSSRGGGARDVVDAP